MGGALLSTDNEDLYLTYHCIMRTTLNTPMIFGKHKLFERSQDEEEMLTQAKTYVTYLKRDERLRV